MTTKEIECFLTVAENHSYVKSASILYYSQPAITYQIRTLEEELGFDLFYPDDRVNLTPAGKIVYKQLRSWNEAWRKTIATAKSASPFSREVLHIATRRLINEDSFTKGLKSFYDTQNRYSFCIHTYHIGGLISDLIQGIRDVVVADSLEIEGIEQFEYQPLCRSCWGFAIPLTDPLAKRKTIQFKDLDGRVIIVPNIPTDMDETIFDRECRRWMRPSSIQYSNSHENAVMTAAVGAAAASINYSIPSQIQNSVFVPIEGFDHYTHGLAWRKDDDRESVRLFVESMKKAFLDSDGNVSDFIG